MHHDQHGGDMSDRVDKVNFVMVPIAKPEYQGRLNLMQVNVLEYVRFRCGGKAFCWGKQDAMAADLYIHRDTFTRALQVLEDKEFLHFERRQHDTLITLQIPQSAETETPQFPQSAETETTQLPQNAETETGQFPQIAESESANCGNCIMEYKKQKRNLESTCTHSSSDLYLSK